MANVKILGDVLQIKSDLTAEMVQKVKTYAPDALKLKDKEGNETFGVDMGDTSISKYGVCFGNMDDEGKLFITINATENLTKEDVTSQFAQLIKNLQFVEESVAAVSEEINDLERAVYESIEVVG